MSNVEVLPGVPVLGFEHGLPVVPVRVVYTHELRRGHYDLLILAECPYCGQQHMHGGGEPGTDPRDFEGHRGSHCVPPHLRYRERCQCQRCRLARDNPGYIVRIVDPKYVGPCKCDTCTKRAEIIRRRAERGGKARVPPVTPTMEPLPRPVERGLKVLRARGSTPDGVVTKKKGGELDSPCLRQHIVAMSDELTRAVGRAIRGAPCTLRALAREAAVPPSTLTRILSGERAATPAVAESVAAALERWGAQCLRIATAIRQRQPRRTR